MNSGLASSDQPVSILQNKWNNFKVSSHSNLANLAHSTDSGVTIEPRKNGGMVHSSSSSSLQNYRYQHGSQENDRLNDTDSNSATRKAITKIYMSSLTQIKLINLKEDEFNDMWRLHYASARNHIEGNIERMANSNVLKSFYLARKMLHVIRRDFTTLVDDFNGLGCHHKLVRNIRERFAEISNQIARVSIDFCCPLVFFDQESVRFLSREFYDNHMEAVASIGLNYDSFVRSVNEISNVRGNFNMK